MIKKAVKGTFGYLDAQKKRVFLRTVIYFAIPLSLLAAGIISTGSRRNLLTVVAILGCLPACKSLVNLILYCRTRGCSEAAHETIVPVSRERGLKGMYDLYLPPINGILPSAIWWCAEKSLRLHGGSRVRCESL